MNGFLKFGCCGVCVGLRLRLPGIVCGVITDRFKQSKLSFDFFRVAGHGYPDADGNQEQAEDSNWHGQRRYIEQQATRDHAPANNQERETPNDSAASPRNSDKAVGPRDFLTEVGGV